MARDHYGRASQPSSCVLMKDTHLRHPRPPVGGLTDGARHTRSRTLVHAVTQASDAVHTPAIVAAVSLVSARRCASARGRNPFPSVLLQPLGHLYAHGDRSFSLEVLSVELLECRLGRTSTAVDVRGLSSGVGSTASHVVKTRGALLPTDVRNAERKVSSETRS